MKRTILLMATLCLQACSTTNPGDVAGITYRLPRTDVKVTLAIDVTGCAHGPVVSSLLTADAVAGVRDGYFHVSGAELSAALTKRSVTIGVDTNGVISAVNTTATDEAASIVGNVLKIGAATATAAQTPLDGTTVACNAATTQNLARYQTLKSLLAATQAKRSPKDNQEDVQKKIDALASAVVTAKAALHREVTGTVTLDPAFFDGHKLIDVPFGPAPLVELFDSIAVTPNDADSDVGKRLLSAFEVQVSGVKRPPPENGLNGGSPATGSCRTSIKVPDAIPVTLTLTPKGGMVLDDEKEKRKPLSQSMFVSQIGTDENLCISAGFGENRTVGLKFDKFGQVTELSWSADARAANIASTLAGSASDASTIAGKIAPSGLTREKAELDELTTQNNLQLARVCQAILAAGGMSCK